MRRLILCNNLAGRKTIGRNALVRVEDIYLGSPYIEGHFTTFDVFSSNGHVIVKN